MTKDRSISETGKARRKCRYRTKRPKKKKVANNAV